MLGQPIEKNSGNWLKSIEPYVASLTMRNVSLNDIEAYIDSVTASHLRGSDNVPKARKLSKGEYQKWLEKAKASDFVMRGELHYFASRILYLKFLDTLSFFLAHQCIENYLKGYLKQAKVPIPQIHDLEKLLAHCKPIAKADFLTSERVRTIILKYAPFYESARYPVQRTNPGSYVSLHPDDIKILDYFVFKMRDILPIQEGFFNGHNMYIDICTRSSPDFLELFKAGNINFS